MTRLRVWWSGGIFAAVTAAYPFLIQSGRAWGADMPRGRAAMIGGPLSDSSEVHVMNRFQIIAGRRLAFIILPAAFWGCVALLFF